MSDGIRVGIWEDDNFIRAIPDPKLKPKKKNSENIYEFYDCIERREILAKNASTYWQPLKNEIMNCVKQSDWDRYEQQAKALFQSQLKSRSRDYATWTIAAMGAKNNCEMIMNYQALTNISDTGDISYSMSDKYCEKLNEYAVNDNYCNNLEQNVIESCDQYDWDAFYDQYRNLVWRCREINSGRFATSSKCSGIRKDDDRWPGK